MKALSFPQGSLIRIPISLHRLASLHTRVQRAPNQAARVKWRGIRLSANIAIERRDTYEVS